jgi:predicted nucleotide-binding protein
LGFVGYLATKPTGATLAEGKKVLDSKLLDGRKLNALKSWGLIEENGEKLRLTERGRLLTRDKGARRTEALRQALAQIRPYAALVERLAHRNEFSITATDAGAYWHEHFREEASPSDKILNDQAVCFFQLAEAAGLGKITIGRHGQATRFDFVEDEARGIDFVLDDAVVESLPDAAVLNGNLSSVAPASTSAPPVSPLAANDRVFITHGKNLKILQQVKEIVAFGKFNPIVAQERETAAKPVPEKVMDDMRSCGAAVIHVSVESVLLDKDGNEHPQINGNVLIEIGAAMALYGRKFILLVEEGVKLPSNLQGLYECRYKGDELSGEATMKLLKAFNEFA